MSRCSTLALFSRSSFTTSVCPSLAAEISAVQQSWDKWEKTPLFNYTDIIIIPGRAKDLVFGCCLWSFRSYQLVIPGGHSEGSSTVTRKVIYCTMYLLVWEAVTVCACKPRHLVIYKMTVQSTNYFDSTPHPHLWNHTSAWRTAVHQSRQRYQPGLQI